MGASGRDKARRSTREILKARQPRRTHFDIVVGDGDLAGLTAALAAAERAVTDAERVKGAGRQAAVDRAREARVAAQSAYDEQIERIYFVGLPPKQYEAVRLANQSPDDHDPLEMEPFILALLAACTVDSDLTAAEWATTIKDWTAIDQSRLMSAVLSANIRPSVPGLGKA